MLINSLKNSSRNRSNSGLFRDDFGFYLDHFAMYKDCNYAKVKIHTRHLNKPIKYIIFTSFRQIVCIMGYGLFGHAVVLLICEAGSDEWFMTLMTLLGGLGSFRICLILLARTAVPAGRFVLCCPVAIIHLLYLVYLHFVIMKR